MTQVWTERFWKYVDKRGLDECWPWTGSCHKFGYGYLKARGKVERAHRLSFLMSFGWLPESVMHKCDNPPCVNPRHLFGGTHADNMADAVRKGRFRRKVTPRVESTILALHECGLSNRAIGRQVGLSHETINRAIARLVV